MRVPLFAFLVDLHGASSLRFKVSLLHYLIMLYVFNQKSWSEYLNVLRELIIKRFPPPKWMLITV